MPTNKRVFTLRLSDEVFDKIGALAAREHRSMTNYQIILSMSFSSIWRTLKKKGRIISRKKNLNKRKSSN